MNQQRVLLTFHLCLQVTVCEAPVLPVTVKCVSCFALSSRYTSGSTDLILVGQCEQCDDQTLVKFLS